MADWLSDAYRRGYLRFLYIQLDILHLEQHTSKLLDFFQLKYGRNINAKQFNNISGTKLI